MHHWRIVLGASLAVTLAIACGSSSSNNNSSPGNDEDAGTPSTPGPESRSRPSRPRAGRSRRSAGAPPRTPARMPEGPDVLHHALADLGDGVVRRAGQLRGRRLQRMHPGVGLHRRPGLLRGSRDDRCGGGDGPGRHLGGGRHDMPAQLRAGSSAGMHARLRVHGRPDVPAHLRRRHAFRGWQIPGSGPPRRARRPSLTQALRRSPTPARRPRRPTRGATRRTTRRRATEGPRARLQALARARSARHSTRRIR